MNILMSTLDKKKIKKYRDIIMIISCIFQNIMNNIDRLVPFFYGKKKRVIVEGLN